MIRSTSKWRLVNLAALAAVGVMAGVVFAADGGGETDVRVLGIRHDDGRVEVGVQQQGMDGGWSDTILPQYRFLPADATGQWLHTSPVSLTTAMMMHDASMEAMPDQLAVDGGSDELYCIVHHGAADDEFWQSFNNGARADAATLGLSNVEIHGEPNLAESPPRSATASTAAPPASPQRSPTWTGCAPRSQPSEAAARC